MVKSETGNSAAIFNWNTPLGLPDFRAFTDEELAAALEASLPAHLAEIEEVASNPAPATFENTIIALELSGKMLNHAGSIFWNLTGSHTNEFLQSVERKMAPEMARHQSTISSNHKLFDRIDGLYSKRGELALDAESDRVLENTWKNFVRDGARLSAPDKEKLAQLNQRLAELGTRFGQSVLGDEQEFHLILNETDDLAGLPDFLIDAMAAAAEERGHKGKHALTLSRSIIEPFLTFSARRELREQGFRAWTSRGAHEGERDNRPIISEIVKLRASKAKILGFDTFADFKLENTMAKTPAAVLDLLESVWHKALRKAESESAELADLVANTGNNHEIAPWDWRYYAEKLRSEKFDFDQSQLKSYLQLDNIIEAAFDTATRLFGVQFRQHHGVETFHPDVRVFEVLDQNGKRVAIFLGDYFARTSKRSGAWMSGLESQHKLAGGATPIVMNTMNFAKAPAGRPNLLSMDDARTLFHEFGHALHGMLSNVTYPSISGTSVSRDFVELPSQLFEHWLTVPETLAKYAVHYQTGEAMPQKLIDRVLAAQTFNSCFATVEFTASALIDMAYHTLDENEASTIDPIAFQKTRLDKLKLPKAIVMRHASPHFAHVFSGDGYSAGYYSYMWSEVLDADAFRAFEENSDPFDPQTAEKLKKHIYSSGDSRDPEAAYTAFRGQMPTPDAMLQKKGLTG